MKSIMQTEKQCYICGNTQNLHVHHCIYGTANRKLSERYGLKVYLCYRHHNGSNEGVHFNRQLDLFIKKEAQKAFENVHGTHEDFMRIFGKNHL